jgi:hypothetical protein
MKLILTMVLLLGSSFAQNSLPFYFPKGVIQTTDPLKQRTEYLRAIAHTWACYQGNPDGVQTLIAEPDSYSVVTDIVSTSSVTQNPAKMRIVLDHYIPMGGKMRVTTLCDQFFIPNEQVKVVVDDLKNLSQLAAKANHQFYSKIYDQAIKIRALKLGIPEKDLIAQLDEKVPGYDVTFRELHHLPKPMKESDFIPRELHLGYNPPLDGILGVTWLNTGVIYYNPDARIFDYIATFPRVLQHEMVHGNVNVEKFPMSETFDFELLADMPVALYVENHTDLPFHGYTKDLRELSEIYFNFDFKQMQKDVFVMDYAGTLQIDPVKYKYYFDQLEAIKKEMLDFFQNVTLPEYYSDPVWWGAMGSIRGDKNSVFRMTMALHYNPTLLGGSKETLAWLELHREEIQAIAEKALVAGLGNTKASGGGGDTGELSPRLIERYQSLFSERERVSIEEYFKNNPEQLASLPKMSPGDLVKFFNKFKTQTKQVVH